MIYDCIYLFIYFFFFFVELNVLCAAGVIKWIIMSSSYKWKLIVSNQLQTISVMSCGIIRRPWIWRWYLLQDLLSVLNLTPVWAIKKKIPQQSTYYYNIIFNINHKTYFEQCLIYQCKYVLSTYPPCNKHRIISYFHAKYFLFFLFHR
jgi:hypothetical protein